MYGLYNLDVYVQNLTASGGTYVYLGYAARYCRNVTWADFHVDSIINYSDGLVNFENNLIINLSNFSMKNCTTTSKVYWMDILGENTYVSIENGTFESLQLYNSPALLLYNAFSYIQISDIKVINVTIGTQTSILEFDSIQALTLSQLSFSQVTSHSQDAEDNFMVEVFNLDFSETKQFSISNVDIDDSQIGFFKFYGSADTPDGHSLNIDNVYMHDCTFPNRRDIFSLNNILYNGTLDITMTNHTFSNVDFVQGGNFYIFGQLLQNPIVLSDLNFINTTSGGMDLGSFSTPTETLKTRVVIKDMSTQNVNSRYGSLITTNTGAELTIEDSTLTNIHCYEEGAVIYAGSEATTVKISNSIFANNTSILGGVIYATSQSSITCQNCTFFNNFGVEGGVVATADNGHFTFTDSNFYSNYAVAGLIANVYDSVLVSSLINATIHDNELVTVTDILQDISTSCVKLCFFEDDFKKYLLANEKLLNVVESPAIIKSVIGTVEVSDSNIKNEVEVIDAYSSTATVIDTSIAD